MKECPECDKEMQVVPIVLGDREIGQACQCKCGYECDYEIGDEE